MKRVEGHPLETKPTMDLGICADVMLAACTDGFTAWFRSRGRREKGERGKGGGGGGRGSRECKKKSEGGFKEI